MRRLLFLIATLSALPCFADEQHDGDSVDIPGLIVESHDTFPFYKPLDGYVAKGQTLSQTKLDFRTFHTFGELRLDGATFTTLDLPIDHLFDPQETGHGLLIHSGGSLYARDSTFASENPAGTRGHFLATGDCTIDIANCVFDGGGRTRKGPLDNAHLGPGRVLLHSPGNQIGRYLWHGHHLERPFSLVDSTFRNGLKVAIAIHNSHWSQIARNVVENSDGAGIVLEGGAESYNTIQGNRVSNVTGDGLGVQGHAGGVEPRLAGDDTPGNERRTIGSLFNEGSGYWFRSLFNDFTGNYASDCVFGGVVWMRNLEFVTVPPYAGAPPAEWIKVPSSRQNIGDRLFRIADNTFERVKTGWSIQGVVGPLLIERQTIRDFDLAFDTSYNDEVILTDFHLENGNRCWRNGFTDKLTLRGGQVIDVDSGFEVFGDLDVIGGDFTGIRGNAFEVYYKAVSSVQDQRTIDGAKFNRASYGFNDPNKGRDYTVPQDLLIRNHNGESYQVFMPEQAPDHIPVKSNPNPMRITYEAGLTNQQLWDKYKRPFGGKLIPPGAIIRPGISGFCAPIPDDLIGPKIIGRTVEASTNGLIVKFETDEPAWICTEYATGDIKLGVPAAGQVLPLKELRTQHEIAITGLNSKTKYKFINLTVDAIGNRGGDARSASGNYLPQTATTK